MNSYNVENDYHCFIRHFSGDQILKFSSRALELSHLNNFSTQVWYNFKKFKQKCQLVLKSLLFYDLSIFSDNKQKFYLKLRAVRKRFWQAALWFLCANKFNVTSINFSIGILIFLGQTAFRLPKHHLFAIGLETLIHSFNRLNDNKREVKREKAFFDRLKNCALNWYLFCLQSFSICYVSLSFLCLVN